MMASAGLLATAALCAYSSDGTIFTPIVGNKITVKVQSGSKHKIYTIRVEMDEYDYVLCSVGYAKGQFTLELSVSVDNQYIDPIPKFSAGVTVSKPNVRVGKANLIAYKAGKRVGHFFYGVEDEWEGELLYASDDVSITGSYTDDDGDAEMYSVNVKKGWNITYEKATETLQITTTNPPSGAKWYYYSYDDDK
jgi:hypothetical protein